MRSLQNADNKSAFHLVLPRERLSLFSLSRISLLRELPADLFAFLSRSGFSPRCFKLFSFPGPTNIRNDEYVTPITRAAHYSKTSRRSCDEGSIARVECSAQVCNIYIIKHWVDTKESGEREYDNDGPDDGWCAWWQNCSSALWRLKLGGDKRRPGNLAIAGYRHPEVALIEIMIGGLMPAERMERAMWGREVR